MILDKLDNIHFYRGLNPRLMRGLEFLCTADLKSLPVGRHAIDGDRLFAIVDEYVTRPVKKVKLEAHRRYHDIQLMVRGAERFGYARLDRVEILEPYEAERDVAFFRGGHDLIRLDEGMFVIFAPQDVHGPQLAAGEIAEVRKIVVKVEVMGDFDSCRTGETPIPHSNGPTTKVEIV